MPDERAENARAKHLPLGTDRDAYLRRRAGELREEAREVRAARVRVRRSGAPVVVRAGQRVAFEIWDIVGVSGTPMVEIGVDHGFNARLSCIVGAGTLSVLIRELQGALERLEAQRAAKGAKP